MKNKLPEFDVAIKSNIDEYTLLYFIDSCKDKKEINVLLHSQGGDAEVAWTIVEYVKINNLKMNVYCSRVESAAIIILSGASNKYAFNNCMFMYHLGIAGDGKVVEQQQHQKKIDYFNECFRGITPKSINLSHNCTYITSREALRLKVIDKIL